MTFQNQTVLLSTAYLPPLEYFYYLMKAERVIIEQFETYPKQTYRNRCVILSGNGKLSLSIPVKKVDGNHTLTKNIALLNTGKWQLNHWRAITAAYSASPFFMYYADELAIFFTQEYKNLLQFNLGLSQTLCRLLGFEPVFSLSDYFEKDNAACTDLRTSISPKRPATLNRFPVYAQVFSDRYGFYPNLSIIDLLFNLGPEASQYLERLG